jgi:DNA mismatch repair protein MutS2
MYEKLTDDERKLIAESLEELEFGSVLEFITKFCYSTPGKELILRSYPGDELYWLRLEHTLIGEMKEMILGDSELPFGGFSDVRSYLQKSLVENAVLSTSDILKVADSIRASRLIKRFFTVRREKFPALAEEAENLHENLMLEKHINDMIDDTGAVKDTATKELMRIRQQILSKSNRLRSRLEKILHRVSEEDMTRDEFITLREGRYVIPVKSEHKKHIPGIIHGMSQTGSTVFLEPSEIFEMNNEISLLLNEEKREIYKILSNLTREIGDEARLFLGSVEVIAHFDAIAAKANYALKYGGVMPEIIDENYIYLNEIRHPLLVHAKGINGVMPLSLEMTKDKRGFLISGPNAGGKTVALKSMGLNIAMALSGIFPLGECKTNYRMIFSSIGDHQSIENDLSTFSSQILKLKDILESASPSSLVLIDEIGSGTDPQEGAALASGIIDTFLELNSFFVVTTHQSSLKSYALTKDAIDNASLEFDEEKLKPTYKFLPGIPGNSYAFVLAESMGMSKLVLERTKIYLGKKQSQLEESISILQKYKSEAEKFRREAILERKKAEEARIKYEEKLDKIKRSRDELIQKAHDEAAHIVTEANRLVENTIRQVKEDKKAAGEIKKEFDKEKQVIQKKIEKRQDIKKKKITDDFEEGDTVTMIERPGNLGSVVYLYPKEKQALVDFNGLKFKVNLSELKKAKTKDKRLSEYAGNISFEVQTRLDVRGKRAFEAIPEIDDFINSALMSNLEEATIIHGKGTGALRHAIHQYLREHPTVKSYRIGTLVEGGDGVTVLQL